MPKYEIDDIPEDPKIPSMKYAVISIVGPHLRQKCDTWAMKVSGVYSTEEAARKLIKKLMSICNYFDMYIVRVGKFFPLSVDPLQLDNVEYQNEQLTNLIKGYIENREEAIDDFNERKSNMISQTIRENKKIKEQGLNERPEHPVAVLQRRKQLKEKLKSIHDELKDLEESITATDTKYESYTEEQKKEAEDILLNAISESLETKENEEFEDLNPEQIRAELLKTLDPKVEPLEPSIQTLLHNLVNEESQDQGSSEQEPAEEEELCEVGKLVQEMNQLKQQLEENPEKLELNIEIERVQQQMNKLTPDQMTAYMTSQWKGESKFANIMN